MPVQRIARYPLLLQTIQKHTEPTHPAYLLLEKTAHTSIALNCRINEYKRFREVGKRLQLILLILIADVLSRFVFMKPPGRTLDNECPSYFAADKYKKTETLTIKDKINRINTHSIAKKTARFSQYFKHEAGIAPKVGCGALLT